jgi:hypothetical protein
MLETTAVRTPLTADPASGEHDAPAGKYKIWVDDPAAFSTHRVQPIHHDFHLHPLMQLPELAKLAKDLASTKQCRFILPGVQQDSEFHHDPEHPSGRSIDEVFRRIEEPGSWIALYNVETHPVYRGFLQEVTASIRDLVEAQQPGMFNVGGFIFISAPPSVTPFHIDRENNFWLQVRGRKTINVWEPTDRHVVAADAVDKFIVYSTLDGVRLQDGFAERSHRLDVGPGDGVYFPSTSPHMTRSDPGWVRPGDGVAVSIGVVFYTDATRRSAHVHRCNLFLRRMGIAPRDPGASVWRDRIKSAAGRLLIWWGRNFRGYEPRQGM